MTDTGRHKLLFLVTEDWFARSHFLPMIARASADGWETVVACRVDQDAAALAAVGARVVPFDFARGAATPHNLAGAAARLARLLSTEKPSVIHAIALQPILTLCLARGAAPNAGVALALTGLGFLATSRAWPAQAVRAASAAMIGRAVRRGRAVLVVENDDDVRAIARVGGPLGEDHVVRLPGAGVDPDAMPALPLPPHPPVRIGVAARLVRSKGIDIAVAAQQRLRAMGQDVELQVAGAADPDNPAAVSAKDIDTWARLPGVILHGKVTDIAAFWADQHIACLPSRGGEGLPRSLLEAAAFARPVVTTDVPGCRDLIGDGAIGRLARADDVASLVDALAPLVVNAELRRELGEAARARIVHGYTIAHVTDRVSAAWRRIAPPHDGARKRHAS